MSSARVSAGRHAPAYAVDINRKKNRALAECGPVTHMLGSGRPSSPVHNYEEIKPSNKQTEEIKTCNFIQGEDIVPRGDTDKPMYRTISKDKLDLNIKPVDRYEGVNIKENVPTKDQKRRFCAKRCSCFLVSFMILVLLVCVCTSLAFAVVEISTLKSELASVQDLITVLQNDSTVNSNGENYNRAEFEVIYTRLYQLNQYDCTSLKQILNDSINELDQVNHSFIEYYTRNQQVANTLALDLKQLNNSYFEDYSAFQQVLNVSLGELNVLNQSYILLNVETLQILDILARLNEPFNPASSCAALLALSPSLPSGHYWVRASNGSAVRVYCDMTRSCGGVTGGWTRVAELDMTNSTNQCPGDLRLRNDSNVRTCEVQSHQIMVVPICSTATFDVKEIRYSKVCGRIRAYQLGSPEAFHPGRDIDDVYVDGVSLTHGNPRQHIWTFAAASNELSINCPCSNTPIPQLSFVGGDYFCDTARQKPSNNSQVIFDNPLWDRIGCSPNNTCCSYNTPPWFYKQLPQPTTDNIEMRVCSDVRSLDDDIAIEAYTIYVQ